MPRWITRYGTCVAVVLALAACAGGSGRRAAAVSVPVAPRPAPTPTSKLTPGPALKLAFADEFDAATLDRTKWNVVGSAMWVNDEQQAYVDSPDTIAIGPSPGAAGGALLLRPQYRPGFVTSTGRKADFISGRINSAGKYAMTYGKVSARIRMPGGQGFWPAFWLLGYGDWPDCGETDIMEYVGERDWTSAAMHGPGYSGETPLVQRQNFPAGTDVAQWHVYTVERTRAAVAFSVDGREFYRVTKRQVERYGVWRFDRPQYIILNFALGGVYPHKVNGIEAPYYGLSQASVEAIEAGRVAMEVDWVRAWSAD